MLFRLPVLLLVVHLACSACTSSFPADATPPPLYARGVILNVTQRSFTELDTIEIRTDTGDVMSVRVEGDTGLTPGHAREHMSFVEPVTVYYRQTSQGPVAFLITD